MTQNLHMAGPVLHAGAPLHEADRVIVLLHGRGASAEDILVLGAALNLPGAAYLAPQADGGTWYPLSFMAPREANEPYLSSALNKIESVVRSAEDAGVNRAKIVIAGFSQGACLATEFVAGHPARYAALLAFTGGLIGPPGSILTGAEHTSPALLAGTPALLSSGDPDPHVPWARVEASSRILENMGAKVTLKRYPGRPHTITQTELKIARELLIASHPGELAAGGKSA